MTEFINRKRNGERIAAVGKPRAGMDVVDLIMSVPNRLAPVFAETENPFPWMSEAMDLKREKNFLATRVIEYQNGGALAWE